MKLNLLLLLAALYLALVGIGYMLAPDVIMFGTLGAGASASLLANIRPVASTFIGIAVLNVVARNAEPSKARDGIILGNATGFALAAILDIVGLLGGAPVAMAAPAAIDLLFTLAFLWATRTSLSTSAA